MLERLRLGETNAEIAVRLGLSPETVKSHVSTMLSKLGLADRRELAAWAPGRERVVGRWWGAALLVAPARAVRRAVAAIVAGRVARTLALAGVIIAVAGAIGLAVVLRPRPAPDGAVAVVTAVTASPTPSMQPSPTLTPAVASPGPTTVPSPTETPTTPTTTTTPIATVRPGCREVVEMVSRPDVTPDPALTEDALVRSGAFRIVPEEYAGRIHYEYCPRIIDPGLPSADEAVLRTSWLFVDLDPIAPPGYALDRITMTDAFPNLYLLHELRDEANNRIRVGRGVAWQLPIDITHCTPGPGCVAGAVEAVLVGGLDAVLARPGRGGGAGLPVLYLYRDGVQTVVTSGHLTVREILDFGERLAAIPQPSPLPATETAVTRAMADAVERLLAARSEALLGPCGDPSIGTTAPGYCYVDPALVVGNRVRLQLGRPESGAGIILFLEERPDGTYELVEEVPYSF